MLENGRDFAECLTSDGLREAKSHRDSLCRCPLCTNRGQHTRFAVVSVRAGWINTERDEVIRLTSRRIDTWDQVECVGIAVDLGRQTRRFQAETTNHVPLFADRNIGHHVERTDVLLTVVVDVVGRLVNRVVFFWEDFAPRLIPSADIERIRIGQLVVRERLLGESSLDLVEEHTGLEEALTVVVHQERQLEVRSKLIARLLDRLPDVLHPTEVGVFRRNKRNPDAWQRWINRVRWRPPHARKLRLVGLIPRRGRSRCGPVEDRNLEEFAVF